MDEYTLSQNFVFDQLNIVAAIIEVGIEHCTPDTVALAALQLSAWLKVLEKNDLLEVAAMPPSTIIWHTLVQLRKSELWSSLCSPRRTLKDKVFAVR
jgi:hypothetical protein